MRLEPILFILSQSPTLVANKLISELRFLIYLTLNKNILLQNIPFRFIFLNNALIFSKIFLYFLSLTILPLIAEISFRLALTLWWFFWWAVNYLGYYWPFRLKKLLNNFLFFHINCFLYRLFNIHFWYDRRLVLRFV